MDEDTVRGLRAKGYSRKAIRDILADLRRAREAQEE